MLLIKSSPLTFSVLSGLSRLIRVDALSSLSIFSRLSLGDAGERLKILKSLASREQGQGLI